MPNNPTENLDIEPQEFAIFHEIVWLEEKINRLSYKMRYLLITSNLAWKNWQRSLARLNTLRHDQQPKSLIQEVEQRETELNKNTESIEQVSEILDSYRKRHCELYSILLHPTRHSSPARPQSAEHPNTPNPQVVASEIATAIKSFDIAKLKAQPKMLNRYKN